MGKYDIIVTYLINVLAPCTGKGGVSLPLNIETLFLADEQAIAQYLAQKSKPDCKVKYFKYLESYKNAKKEVETIFEHHSGKAHLYQDMIHAEKKKVKFLCSY